MRKPLLWLFFSFFVYSANAACPGGQIEVSISIKTDDYGKEGYWQLVPTGNACGTGTIFAGGNASVGCNGAGQHNNFPGGYSSNSTITEGPWCLTTGASYDIIYTDDYTDGGFTFTIYINGFPVYQNLAGTGATGTRFTFVASPPPALDVACRGIKTPSYVTFGNVYPKVWVANFGTDTVHSVDLYYSIDNNPYQLSSVSGLNIYPFDSQLVSANIPWVVSAIADHSLSMNVSNPNGGTDINASNDSTERNVATGPATPNIIDDYLTGNSVPYVIGNSSNQVNFPTDLDFHPVLTRYELWVILRGTTNGGGSTVKFMNAGMPNQTSLKQTDGNAGHFMDLPSGIAFSENENFATSPSVYDANHSGGNPFTGPSLWSSDSTIYCHTPPGGNGSHIDMLHQSPYAMGICSEEENIFWVYDNNDHDIVRYDFKKDHGPGNSDHSDGVIRRFTGLGLDGDPAHMIGSGVILDKTEGMLYIADTWNDRILKMDINSGTFLTNLTPYEGLAEYSSWDNVNSSTFAGGGIGNTVARPSGIDLIENRLVVSEYQSGDIIIYDIGATATEMGRIHTGTPGIMGVKIGPDGKIWYVNALTDEVVRLDQINVGVNELSDAGFALYPNPAADKLNVLLSGKQADGMLSIIDMKGSVLSSQNISSGEKSLIVDIASLANGVYTLSVQTTNEVVVKRFVKE